MDYFERLRHEERQAHFWEEAPEECPVEELDLAPVVRPKEEWASSLHSVFTEYMQTVLERTENRRLDQLEVALRTLTRNVSELESRTVTAVHVDSFAPEPFEVLKEVKVIVEGANEEFTATSFDAGVSASGCTALEAFENLKDLLISRFDLYSSLPEENLGKGPRHTISVLRQFMRRVT
jgi:hypothetical protein